MKLVVATHKPFWFREGIPETDGGFPSQIEAIASLFDSTILIATRRSSRAPRGTRPVECRSLEIALLPEPAGTGILRKAWALAFTLPRLRRTLSLCTVGSDARHVAVPGDIGTMAALLWRRHPRLFIRHCGTWGHRTTLADRFLAWWLPRLARSGRAIVFATGAGDTPPAPGCANLHWIFSTALSAADLERVTPAKPWQPGWAPRLVAVGRLTRGKNFHAAIEALVAIRADHPLATLEILGDGPARGELETLARKLGLESAVSIRGNVCRDQVLETLSRSHLFVFPTRVAEGFPKAVLEALACGVPVLSPRVSVLPRLLAEGGGRLLDATDAESVAAGVLELLASPERLPEMGAAARRTASGYTLERWRDEIGRVLEAAWGPLRST